MLLLIGQTPAWAGPRADQNVCTDIRILSCRKRREFIDVAIYKTFSNAFVRKKILYLPGIVNEVFGILQEPRESEGVCHPRQGFPYMERKWNAYHTSSASRAYIYIRRCEQGGSACMAHLLVIAVFESVGGVVQPLRVAHYRDLVCECLADLRCR